MSDDTPSPLNNVITIDDERIKSHLDRVVRGTVEETLNALLDAEADRLCNAQRYERSAARRDSRAGHYERGLQTKAGEVRNVSLLVAIGVNERGYREILGICEGAKEDKTGWSAFLKHLKERGLKGVRLITSDACIGLAESAAEFFPEAAWQRCVVHWYRNIFSHVPSTRVREIAAMLKAIHASEDIAAAREKAIRVIEKLRGLRLSRAAELVEAAVEETLT